MDLITDFAFPDGPRVRNSLTRHAAAIRGLLAQARAQGVPVIYANDCPGIWRSDGSGLIARCTRPTLAGAKLVSSLLPLEQDEFMLKPRHSAFFGTPLMTLLDQHQADTLIIAGISGESCVWMTACDAHTRGFQLVIPADTIAGASAAAQRRTLTSMKEVLKARVPAKAQSLRFRRGKIL